MSLFVFLAFKVFPYSFDGSDQLSGIKIVSQFGYKYILTFYHLLFILQIRLINQERKIVKISLIVIITLNSILYGWTQNIQTPDSTQIQKVTKIYMVRHAEKEKSDNPPLNEKGKIRANHLKKLLVDSGITAIYCPNLLRNKQTAGPLAQQLNINIRLISGNFIQNTRALAEYFISEIIPKHTGETILFVGNAKSSGKEKIGNLQAIYQELGGTTSLLTRYSDIHTVIIKADTTEFKHNTYGTLSDY